MTQTVHLIIALTVAAGAVAFFRALFGQHGGDR